MIAYALALLLLAQSTPPLNLQDDPSIEGDLYRATNRWQFCAEDVADAAIKQRPEYSKSPTAVAEAAVLACKEERVAFDAIAEKMIRRVNLSNTAQPMWTEIQVSFRLKIIGNVTEWLRNKANPTARP